MMNRNTNKKANVKSDTISSKAFLSRFIIIVIVTSPIQQIFLLLECYRRTRRTNYQTNTMATQK